MRLQGELLEERVHFGTLFRFVRVPPCTKRKKRNRRSGSAWETPLKFAENGQIRMRIARKEESHAHGHASHEPDHAGAA